MSALTAPANDSQTSQNKNKIKVQIMLEVIEGVKRMFVSCCKRQADGWKNIPFPAIVLGMQTSAVQ